MYRMSMFLHAKPKNVVIVFIITQILLCLSTANTTPLQSQFSKVSREAASGFGHSIRVSMSQAESARAVALNLISHKTDHRLHSVAGPMNDCIELLDDSIDQLSNIINANNDDDVQTWLSAALTNQDTCLESLGKGNYKFEGVVDMKPIMLIESMVKNLSHSIDNCLAVFVLSGATANDIDDDMGNHRRLLSSNNSFPTWVSASERKLLEASINEIQVNAVVDKHGNGSGIHKTIGEAIDELLASEGRTVIHVKAGTYHENLKFSTKQKNVMLVGDGKGITVIVGNRNAEDGSTTFQSATVAAMGDGFIARDITFVNSAGPAKHQAVALRVGSDKSVIFRCSILGYQDTLYTHSKRQFYRETDIYGTVDFIFGNSAVVFQNCYINARSSRNNNFITAQGRTTSNQNTGISIHNCKIVAGSSNTYLGRPWKPYSRTVIMQSFLDASIHRSGWSPWSGDFALNTLYYGEYMNSGPGSSTSARVNWPGYHPSLSSMEAQQFTVAAFISGNLWLPSTGVSFDSGLLG